MTIIHTTRPSGTTTIIRIILRTPTIRRHNRPSFRNRWVGVHAQAPAVGNNSNSVASSSHVALNSSAVTKVRRSSPFPYQSQR